MVITNPPFSLMKKYVPFMVESGKQFLFLMSFINMGNTNTVKPILQNKCWPSYTSNKSIKFIRPDGTYKSICVGWLTNLIRKSFRSYTPTAEYDPEIYPKYNEIDAIFVRSYKDIPKNYFEPMGVPVNFYEYWNPDEWELLGNEFYINGKSYPYMTYNRIIYECPQPRIETVIPFQRIIIKYKNPRKE